MLGNQPLSVECCVKGTVFQNGYNGTVTVGVKEENRAQFFNMPSGRTAIRVNYSLFRYPEAEASLPTFSLRNFRHTTVSITPQNVKYTSIFPLKFGRGEIVSISVTRVPTEGKGNSETSRQSFSADQFINFWNSSRAACKLTIPHLFVNLPTRGRDIEVVPTTNPGCEILKHLTKYLKSPEKFTQYIPMGTPKKTDTSAEA